MGLMLDSTVVVAVERRGEAVAQFLRQVTNVAGDQEFALSSIGLTELVHALYRAPSTQIHARREAFILELLGVVEVVPFAKSTAFLAGRIDGEQRSVGVTIPSLDLLIGATALEIGYAVVTVNLRHFRLIPGLKVVTL
jgi:predicted nucleic acid-binding protein